MGTGCIQPKYQCPECYELHDDYDSARECCVPQISELWECPVCRKCHGDEEMAIECCGFDPDGPPPPPTAAELEAAGQTRLF
jgi:hypothetical protein